MQDGENDRRCRFRDRAVQKVSIHPLSSTRHSQAIYQKVVVMPSVASEQLIQSPHLLSSATIILVVYIYPHFLEVQRRLRRRPFKDERQRQLPETARLVGAATDT